MEKQLKGKLKSALWYIDYHSGYRKNSQPVDYGNPSSFDEACAILKSGMVKAPFDLVHHQGSSWEKEKWDKHVEWHQTRRKEAIEQFLKLVSENTVHPRDILVALEEVEHDRKHYGSPWGLPYARLFLKKWRCFSWEPSLLERLGGLKSLFA